MGTKTRKAKLKRNNRGWFPKEVGYLDFEKKRQPKFNLGTDEAEADRRLARIYDLFEDNQRDTGGLVWTEFALGAAKDIAAGAFQIVFEFDKTEIEDLIGTDDLASICSEYVQTFRAVQQRFPSIHLVPGDQDVFNAGVKITRQIEQIALASVTENLTLLNIASGTIKQPEKVFAGSLHQAFDAYAAHIQKTGHKLEGDILKPAQRKRLEYVEVLKQHHADEPLMTLTTYDAVHELLSYWANRPEYASGKRYKPTTARHRRKELERFLRWLDLTSEFDWEMPRGADQIRVTTVELEEDHQTADLLTKVVYSPAELALIAEQAKGIELLMLLVGVNCAFGAAEVGRLIVGEILLRQQHEHAERLLFESTSNDSFIRLKRPKSKMFGEWLLWSETVQILEWAITRSQKLGTPYLLVTNEGNPLYDERRKNPGGQTDNRWEKLIARVRKEAATFPSLPYGTLRDTLPNILRQQGYDTLASISLAHKTSFKADNLLEAYGNKPFGRLHEAIRDLREHFAPFLEAARRKL